MQEKKFTVKFYLLLSREKQPLDKFESEDLMSEATYKITSKKSGKFRGGLSRQEAARLMKLSETAFRHAFENGHPTLKIEFEKPIGIQTNSSTQKGSGQQSVEAAGMNLKLLASLGAGLIIVGLFLPIATLPLIGSITLMSNGFTIVAIGLLILGLMSGFFVWAERRDALIWTGGAALLIIIYMFARLLWSIIDMRSNMADDLEGNPFAALAQTMMASVGLQWGWLILAAGPAIVVYVAVRERLAEGSPTFSLGDRANGIAAIVSAMALAIAPLQHAWSFFHAPDLSTALAEADTSSPLGSVGTSTHQASAEEARYIADNLRLYEFTAKYYESVLDGRVPGVSFKIKNNGNRTINSLTVKVVFFDANNQPIGERLYRPVNVGGFSMGNEGRPLRPNYIWQQEPNRFYAAKTVPSEWSEGNARATIVDVAFASTS